MSVSAGLHEERSGGGRTEYEFWSFSLEPVARILGE